MSEPALTREDRSARRRAFGQWIIAANDPLIPIRTRMDIDRRMREWSRRTPGFCITWSTGVTATILASLPDPDPWRRPHPDFGTYRDAQDLVYMPPAEDGGWDRSRILMDLSLAALADPMPPGAAHVFGACGLSVEDGQFAFTELREQIQSRKDALTVDIAQSIVGWSTWRRRVYEPVDDPFPMSTAFSWLAFAAQIERGEGYPVEENTAAILMAKLDDDAYHLAAVGADDELGDGF